MCVCTDFESHAAKYNPFLLFHDMFASVKCVGEQSVGVDEEWVWSDRTVTLVRESSIVTVTVHF